MAKEVIKAVMAAERILTEDSDAARELYNQSVYGKVLSSNRIQLSLIEALYLLEKQRLEILDGRRKFSWDIESAREKNVSLKRPIRSLLYTTVVIPA